MSKLSNGAQPTAAASHNADDPFGDNDEDEIARIAREMEAKYVRFFLIKFFFNLF